MRARLPDTDGYVEHRGVKIGYEVYGDAAPAIVLLPTWNIIHTRFWKLQIPYLARHHRVVVFDGPGNGRSDRPADPAGYAVDAVAGATVAVMDATGTDAAVLVGLSAGAFWSLRVAVDHPARVLGQVLIAPAIRLLPTPAGSPQNATDFHRRFTDPEGWQKYNEHHWREHYEDFLEFFFAECFSEPHSTKPREDTVGWGRETTAEVLLTEYAARATRPTPDMVRAMGEQLQAPVLIIHGGDDHVVLPHQAPALAAALGAELVVLEGSGHIPVARDPVKVNHLIAGFARGVAP
jgi:pimeloyl-ACP methyl ester carboxylesterase